MSVNLVTPRSPAYSFQNVRRHHCHVGTRRLYEVERIISPPGINEEMRVVRHTIYVRAGLHPCDGFPIPFNCSDLRMLERAYRTKVRTLSLLYNPKKERAEGDAPET
jgi:hypothetical protein